MHSDSGYEKQKKDTGRGAALRPILSKAAHGKRHEIAAQITTRAGRRVTVAMLNDWCALTKPHLRFPADLVEVFCEVTGDDSLQRKLLSPRLRALLELGEFVAQLLEENFLEIQKKAPR